MKGKGRESEPTRAREGSNQPLEEIERHNMLWELLCRVGPGCPGSPGEGRVRFSIITVSPPDQKMRRGGEGRERAEIEARREDLK